MSSTYFSRFFALTLLFSLIGAPVVHAAASKAEGADRSAAAKGSKWVGTIIGVNFGEHSIVITEGTVIDHIKKFAQRSVKITSDTAVYKNGEMIAFDDLDVGQRITAQGVYNAKTRIITADQVDVGAIVATVAVTKPQKVAAVVETAQPVTAGAVVIKKNLQVGSKGPEVIALQKFLIAQGHLVVAKNTKLGSFGGQTRAAVRKYQKSVGVSTTGTVGPQTRAKISKS